MKLIKIFYLFLVINLLTTNFTKTDQEYLSQELNQHEITLLEKNPEATFVYIPEEVCNCISAIHQITNKKRAILNKVDSIITDRIHVLEFDAAAACVDCALSLLCEYKEQLDQTECANVITVLEKYKQNLENKDAVISTDITEITRGPKLAFNLRVIKNLQTNTLKVCDTACIIGLLTAGNAHFRGNVIIDGGLIINNTSSTIIGCIEPGTDNAVARYDGTTCIQPSAVNLSDVTAVVNPAANSAPNYVAFTVTNPSTSFVLAPNGQGIGGGALQANPSDGTAAGGNGRGANSVDFQLFRISPTQVASGITAVISGGQGNTASGNISVVSGGSFNIASNTNAIVVGGTGNTASGDHSFIGGGTSNNAAGINSTVTGGTGNNPTTTGDFSFVGGGSNNSASGSISVVGGGSINTASGSNSVVAGGIGNSASNLTATVGGGGANSASGLAAVVAGGAGNTASGPFSSIGGGFSNIVTTTSGTIAGGTNNLVTGTSATIPGGANNLAQGAISLAAGQNAHALFNGSFVWADATSVVLTDTQTNQFVVRASGGTAIWSNSPQTLGVFLAPNATAWSAISDRKLKENFKTVDTLDILEKVTHIPIETWNYKDSPNKIIRHIGPMAQDFALFGFGEDPMRISTLDADGVLFAAVQGLNRKLEQQVAELKREITELKRTVLLLLNNY